MKVFNIVFILLLLLSSLLIIGNLDSVHNWGGDFAGYIMQAKSLVEGTAGNYIKTNSFIVQNSSKLIGPAAYPWGYPLLLSPIYSLFGINFVAFKIIGVISYLLFLITLWVMFKKVHSKTGLLILIAAFALNPTLIRFTNQIMSDLPFLLLSTLSIWLIQKLVVKKQYVISCEIDYILLGLLITYAFLIRANGLLLVFTYVLTYLIDYFQNSRISPSSFENINPNYGDNERAKQKKSLKLLLIPLLVFLIGILISKVLLPGGESTHIAHLKDISFSTLKYQFFYYFIIPGRFFAITPYGDILFNVLMFGFTLPLAIKGIFLRYKKDYPLVIYIIFTYFLYLIWPGTQGIRFLFPILPFYFSFVISGLEEFSGKGRGIEKALRKLVIVVPVFLLVSAFLLSNITSTYNQHKNSMQAETGPFNNTSTEMFSYIEKHTKPADVIIFFKPRVLNFFTGRLAIMTEEIEQINDADYLCYYLPLAHYRQIPLQAIQKLTASGRIHQICKNKDFIFYKIAK